MVTAPGTVVPGRSYRSPARIWVGLISRDALVLWIRREPLDVFDDFGEVEEDQTSHAVGPNDPFRHPLPYCPIRDLERLSEIADSDQGTGFG